MAVTYIGTGTTAYSTSNPAPGLPTRVAGDMLILAVGTKPDTTPATTPNGWTQLGTAQGGTGTTGTDAGPMRVGLFYRIADGTAADSPGSIVVTGNNVSAASIYCFRKTAALWDIAGVGAADTSTGATFSATMPSNPGLTVGDMLFAVGVIPTDITTPAQFTNEQVSATGMTTVTLTEIEEWDTQSGSDMGGWVARGNVVTGTASGNPTVTSTASGTTTAVAGPIYLVRMREVSPTAKSGSDTASLSIADSSSKSVSSIISISSFSDAFNDASQWNITGPGGVSGGTLNVTTASGINTTATTKDMLAMVNTSSFTVEIPFHPQWPNYRHGIKFGTAASNGGIEFDYYTQESYSTQNGVAGVTTPMESATPYRWVKFTKTFGTTMDISVSSDATNWTSQESVNVAEPGYITIYSTGSGNDSAKYDNLNFFPAAPEAVSAVTPGDLVTGTFLPPANSTIVVSYAQGQPSGAMTNPNISNTGNALTWTNRIMRHRDEPTAGNDNGLISVWTANAGASPSLMTVTVADTIAGTFNKMLVAETFTDDIVDAANPIGTVTQGPFTSTSAITPTGNAQTTGGRWRLLMSDHLGAAVPTAPYFVDANTTLLGSSYSAGSGMTALLGKTNTTTQGTNGNLGVNHTESSLWVVGNYALYELRFPTSETPISGSDTSSVSISDSSSVDIQSSVIPISGSDTSSVAISETTSSVRTIVASDTSSIGISDSSSTIKNVNLSSSDYSAVALAEWSSATATVPDDTSSISISETSQVDIEIMSTPISGSDTASLGISETTSSVRTIVAADTASVAIAESRTISTTLSRTDTASLAIAETTSSARTIVASDTASVSISDIGSVGSTLPGTDTSAIGIAEQAAVAKTSGAADTATLSITETSVIHKSMVASDTASLAISDTRQNASSTTTNDTSAVLIVESAAVVVSVVTNDSASLSITETAGNAVSLATSDTASLTSIEYTASARVSAHTDSSTISITETSGIQVLNSFPGEDTGNLAITEQTATQSTGGTSDTASLVITESSAVAKSSSASDTASLVISESTQIGRTSGTSDTGAVVIVESSSIVVTLSASDTSSVAISESRSNAKSSTRGDSATIAISETSAVFKQIAASDTTSVSITEVSNVGSTLPGTDSSTIGIAEQTNIFITSSATDTSALVISESRSQDASLSAADTNGLVINETRSQSVYISRSDTGGLHVADTIGIPAAPSVNKTTFTSDAGSLSIDESYELLVEVSDTDESILETVETTKKRIPGQFSTYVRMGGTWEAGTIKVFKNGQWEEADAKIYEGSTWS